MDYMKQVREHAASLDMTPIELCRAVGIAESTWRRWRAGSFAPQLRTLEKLLAHRKEISTPRRGLAEQ